jgi:hypothetical protein
MHVLIAGLYATIIWLSLLAYMLIVGLHPGWVLLLGPVIISGVIAVLLALDFILEPLWPIVARRWAWLSSCTVRLWAWRPARWRTSRD